MIAALPALHMVTCILRHRNLYLAIVTVKMIQHHGSKLASDPNVLILIPRIPYVVFYQVKFTLSTIIFYHFFSLCSSLLKNIASPPRSMEIGRFLSGNMSGRIYFLRMRFPLSCYMSVTCSKYFGFILYLGLFSNLCLSRWSRREWRKMYREKRMSVHSSK